MGHYGMRLIFDEMFEVYSGQTRNTPTRPELDFEIHEADCDGNMDLC